MTPWVIVEAAAAKIPVIASDVGAVRETVRDGETGFLLRRNHEEEDFVRAASMLLSDASMGERMGLAAQVNVRTANSRDVVFGRLFERLMSL
jgi:glycosyltransferase involved in cell wall biosynthesis